MSLSVTRHAARTDPRYPAPISHAVSGAPDLGEDTQFLQQQARQYLSARPWERLDGRAVFMALKAGSWYQVCAQPFDNTGEHVLFVFPGWRDSRELHRAGFDQPPPLTIMAALADPASSFQMADDDGWLPLDRFSGQLLALAMAAIIRLNAIGGPTDTEVSGELQLPGRVRGRYRAVLKPHNPDDDRLVPVMSKVRMDLLEEGETTLSFMNLGWDTYRELSKRAQLMVPWPDPFEDRGESIPVVVISDGIKRAWTAADKLRAAEPLDLSLMPMEASLGVIVSGPEEGYCLTMLKEQAAAVRAWWQAGIEESGGAIALMVVDTTPDPNRLDKWAAANVLAVFEFGSRKAAASNDR
jgi:hypothetical protein